MDMIDEGRARVLGKPRAMVHLFGSIASAGTPATYIQPDQGRGSREGKTDIKKGACEERLHLVSTRVREVLRDGTQAPLTPLDEIDFEVTDNATISESSVLRIRVLVKSDSLESVYIIDAGQSWELYAEEVDLEILGPLGTRSVPRDGAAFTASGTVFDSLLTSRILGIERGTGAGIAKFSEQVPVPAGAVVVRPIPNGAQWVVGHMGLDGVLPPSTQWMCGDSSVIGEPAAFEVGLLPWDGFGGQPRTIQQPVPAGASHYRINADGANARIFSFVWGIRA